MPGCLHYEPFDEALLEAGRPSDGRNANSFGSGGARVRPDHRRGGSVVSPVESSGRARRRGRDRPGRFGTAAARLRLRYRGIQAPRLTVTALTPDRRSEYAGDYWSAELQRVVRLEIRGDQLMIWHRATGWICLLPTDADRFDTEAGQTIEFSRDAGLRVSEMRVSGGRGRHLRFRRVTLDRRSEDLISR
jgi:hypothetical protein